MALINVKSRLENEQHEESEVLLDNNTVSLEDVLQCHKIARIKTKSMEGRRVCEYRNIELEILSFVDNIVWSSRAEPRFSRVPTALARKGPPRNNPCF